ncbi:SRPBCC family protein [Actinokineospora terrae]|uniref:Polyketide cyclase / dehydrase and lipid transport n=1 Tax=Actinokineospora terrae TaxID=155974 RepID=A0A1H9MLE3_9PSEU|nr:SRPBCC family protein [Actinokineospora terrae]SER24349.1 Polyketide cyclase / dehydrase and lipid transport [Actinokineospora terrae]
MPADRTTPGPQSYDVTADSAASPAAVWALLRDPLTWPTWSRVDTAALDQSSPDGGVGAIWVFRTGKVVTKERVTALEPERRFAYEGLENPQLTDYRAAVDLSELPGGGTRIRWHGTFSARWGMRWFTQRYLRRYMLAVATGLARHAAGQTGRS